MREIEFRGKAGGQWVYGNLVEWPQGEFQIWTKIRADGGHNYMVDPETVGQYTGLKDVKGARIFEGDIIALWAGLRQPKIFLVVWGKDWAGWCAKDKNDESSFHCKDKLLSYIEVIGNIHDTPELLGEEIRRKRRENQ